MSERDPREVARAEARVGAYEGDLLADMARMADALGLRAVISEHNSDDAAGDRWRTAEAGLLDLLDFLATRYSRQDAETA